MNHSKQHTLWLLAAIAAPIAHFSGTGWLTAALTALIVLPMTLIRGSWDFSRPVAIGQILWLGVVAGLMLPGSAVYWPSDNTAVVPLTLLALAVLTSSGAAPRVGAVLALCMALLAIPIAICAASRIEPVWLKPAIRPWSPALTVALLISALPAAGKTRRGRSAAAAAMLTLLLTLLVQGTIGSIRAEDPFYQTARTLGHMEPVAAAAMTLGWYALTCFLFQSGMHIARSCKISQKWASVLLLGTSTIPVLFPQQPNPWFVSVLSLFLWVIAPFGTKIKDFEKPKNSA